MGSDLHGSRPTVLLVQPPIRDFYFTRKRTMPYGLMSMAACLDREGVEVILIDALATTRSKILPLPGNMAYLEPCYGREDRSPFCLFHHYRHYGYSIEHIGRLARQSGAFLVGISSLFTAYADEALAVAREIRKALPRSRIVVGGHHPTQLPEAVMAEPCVDFVIRGEGEIALARLVRCLLSGESLEDIEGLVYREKDGGLRLCPPTVVMDPEAFPLPRMDLVNHDFYGRKTGNSAVIMASRGCPMRCSYCCVAKPASVYRKRSVAAVFEEIRRAVDDHGARFIDFEDENLTLDKGWCLDLMHRISDHFGHLGLELRAMNGLFPPSLDTELLEAMKDAGFSALNLSLCTVDPNQLKRFNRVNVRSAVERVLAWAEARGLSAVCYILVGAPGQDPMTSVDDLLYLAGHPTLAGVSVYYPAPGSMDYQQLDARGALPSSFALMRSSAVPVSDTTSRLESLTLLRLGRMLNFSKELKRQGLSLRPRPLVPGQTLDIGDRNRAGHALLEAFYHDRRIFGLDDQGRVYEHQVATDLCRAYHDGTADLFCG